MMNTFLYKNKAKEILEALTNIPILITTVIRWVYLDWGLDFKILYEILTRNMCEPFHPETLSKCNVTALNQL